VLFAMIRRSRPRTVLELGAGLSTLVIADALDANAAESRRGSHIVVDPYPPRERLGARLDGDLELRQIRAERLPLHTFEALQKDDVLFIDTTHTVKIGSEVVYLVLEVLPRLAPGVIVHIHDIFLPWHYPRELAEDLNYHWAEQYIIQAFLAFNQEFAVLVANHQMEREAMGRLREFVPLSRSASAPSSSLWLHRLERDGAR
jgi:predicted O-methyltransferase YrrM